LYDMSSQERRRSPLFVGKPFEALYDLKTLTPKNEELDLYNAARKAVEELGLTL